MGKEYGGDWWGKSLHGLGWPMRWSDVWWCVVCGKNGEGSFSFVIMFNMF